METHLKINNLAPYLPHGLKVQYIGELDDNNERHDSNYIRIGETAKIGSVEFRFTNPIYWMDFKRGYFGITSFDFKPILRPLSDITKEIEHNGERFVLIDVINDFVPIGNYFGFKIEFDSLGQLGYRTPESWLHPLLHIKFLNKLFEYHFDIFGLIDEGLAIDTNTLK